MSRRFVGVRFGFTAFGGAVWWSRIDDLGSLDPTPIMREADIVSVEDLTSRIYDELAEVCESERLTRKDALGRLVVRPVYRKVRVTP